MLGAGAVTGSWNHPILGCEIDAKAQNLASAVACEPWSLRSFLATRGSSGKSWTLWMDIVRISSACQLLTKSCYKCPPRWALAAANL